jgi:hypothetical protein
MSAATRGQREVLGSRLRSKLTPGLNMLLDMGSFTYWFGIGMAVLLLYGPIVGPHKDHNLFRYIVAPWICPFLVAGYYRVAGYNPYGTRSGYSFWGWGRPGFDKTDADAKRLVDTFRSVDAKRAVLRCSLRVSVTIFALIAIAALASRHSLSLSLWSYWTGQGFLGCCLGSYIAVSWLFVNWGVQNWARDANAVGACEEQTMTSNNRWRGP